MRYLLILPPFLFSLEAKLKIILLNISSPNSLAWETGVLYLVNWTSLSQVLYNRGQSLPEMSVNKYVIRISCPINNMVNTYFQWSFLFNISSRVRASNISREGNISRNNFSLATLQ